MTLLTHLYLLNPVGSWTVHNDYDESETERQRECEGTVLTHLYSLNPVGFCPVHNHYDESETETQTETKRDRYRVMGHCSYMYLLNPVCTKKYFNQREGLEEEK